MIKEVYTVDTQVTLKGSWDGTIFLAGPIERIVDGQAARLPRWRDAALKFLDQRPEKLVVYNPQWDSRPAGWTYEAQVKWELSAMAHAWVRLFWVARELPLLPGFTTNIEWGKWWDNEHTVSGAPPAAQHTKYMQTLHKLIGKPWYISLQQCCDIAVGLLNSEPWTDPDNADGGQPTYCLTTGWPDPIEAAP